MNSRRRHASGLVLAPCLLLLACDSGERDEALAAAASSAAPGPLVQRPGAELPPQVPRSRDEAALRATRALEEGRLDDAAAALLELPSAAELERRILLARLRGSRGDAVGAVQMIEAARADWPDQGRVFATAAELHAIGGRVDSAQEEVRRGLEVAGPTPELLRARGILSLGREGGADLGLQHLLDALEEDPELPFCDLALVQAHVLLGRRAMAEDRPLEALGHSVAAQAARPDDVDAIELQAEAQEAGGDFGGAIDAWERLAALGAEVGAHHALACQRGSTAALVEGDRALALARALRARELGLSDEELGFGLVLIEEEGDAALDAGVAAYAEGRAEDARVAFELAARCLPDSLEARNHVAVALFRAGEYGRAAEHWRYVVEKSWADGIELPEPVHVNLARALEGDGRVEEARGVLEQYLGRAPEGVWVEATREALEGMGE